MSSAVDMEAVVQGVLEYDALDGMKGPAQVDSTEQLTDVLTDLIHAISMRGVSPDKCQFYMHPVTHNELMEKMAEVNAMLHPSGFKGRPIKMSPGIPEDVILFMAPDAVSLAGKVYNPLVIAYARLVEEQ